MQHAAATSAKPALGQAVIVFPNAGGGSETSVGTVQINDLEGNPVTRAVVIDLVLKTTPHGTGGASGTVTFGSATTGVILEAAGGHAAIRTDAAGLFACTITNTADQTLHLMCGVGLPQTALTEGIVVVEQIADSIVWSA